MLMHKRQSVMTLDRAKQSDLVQGIMYTDAMTDILYESVELYLRRRDFCCLIFLS